MTFVTLTPEIYGHASVMEIREFGTREVKTYPKMNCLPRLAIMQALGFILQGFRGIEYGTLITE